jgi:hypothetical protein
VVVDAGASEGPSSVSTPSGPIVPPPAWVGPAAPRGAVAVVRDDAVEVAPAGAPVLLLEPPHPASARADEPSASRERTRGLMGLEASERDGPA